MEYLLTVWAFEGARRATPHIREHPSRNDGIEHHEQVVSRKADPLERMPPRAGGFEHVEAARDALPARAADGEFHDQQRKAEHHEEQDVDEHECRAAVLPCDIGEAPDVAQADGAACADEDEAETGAETFARRACTTAT